MSHYMTALAMKQKGLKPATKIVLYWLADHHNGETGLCCPSVNTLADECEMDRSSIIRHLNTLEQLGLIQRTTRNRDNGSQRSNEFALMLENATPPVANCDPTPIAKCDPFNLGNNNLGKETNISSSNDDGVDYYFDQLWEEYPRKVGKAQAKKAFKTASKKINFYDLLPKFEAYVLTLKGKETQFIPHLATWLNGERWKDEGQ